MPTVSMQQQAEECAKSVPVGIFGIDDILIAIEIIYYGFQLWHACSAASSVGDALTSAKLTKQHPLNYRRARRRIILAANSKGKELSMDQANTLTNHMLNFVSQADPATVNACCSEPQIEDDDSDD